MKLSKEKQQHLILVAMVGVIVIVGLYFFVISGQQSALTALDKKIAEAQGNLDKARAVLKSEPIVIADLTTKTNELVAQEATLATGSDKFFWFITTLNRFKVPYQNQVEIPNISREAPAEPGIMQNFPYKAVAFTLRGVAHFHTFGRFLADFENKFPYFRVQKLALSPAAADMSEAPEKISFEMEIITLINPGP